MSIEPGEVRLVLDVAAGALLASAARLVLMKAFLEPAAYWAGRTGLKHIKELVAERLGSRD